MAVAVEGDGDGRVAEAFLDGLGVGAEGDAEGGAGVAEVVEPGPVRQPRSSDGGLEGASVEVLVVQDGPVG